MKDNVSYDRLNALVDGQLDRFEADRVFEAIRSDPELERRVGELRQMKELVRHAYQHEPLAGSEDRRRKPRNSRWMAVAAIALIALGVGAGWTGHAWQQRDGENDFSWLVHRAGAVAPVAADNRVVLHVNSSASDRVSAMLDDAEGMLRAARAAGRPVAIEILADNTGLDVLRIDVPGPSGRLALLRTENPNLTLVACGQTIERLRERGVVVQLLPQTVVATSALDEVVKRIHEGWTYVRT